MSRSNTSWESRLRDFQKKEELRNLSQIKIKTKGKVKYTLYLYSMNSGVYIGIPKTANITYDTNNIYVSYGKCSGAFREMFSKYPKQSFRLASSDN